MDKDDALTLILYGLALMSVAAVQVYLFTMFFDYILLGLGVGVYAVYGYLLTLLVTSLAWLVSFWRKRNLVAATAYWLVALAIAPVLLIQPIWWSAPPLN